MIPLNSTELVDGVQKAALVVPEAKVISLIQAFLVFVDEPKTITVLFALGRIYQVCWRTEAAAFFRWFVNFESAMKLLTCFSARLSSSLREMTAIRADETPAPLRIL